MSLNSKLVKAVLDDDAYSCSAQIKAGADPNCKVDENWRRMFCEMTCLQYAISRNRLKAAEALIENGADLFAYGSFNYHIGPYPLFAICANEKANHLLRLVINKGCDIQKTYEYHSGAYRSRSGVIYGSSDTTYSAMKAAILSLNIAAIDILLSHKYVCSDEEIRELIINGNERQSFTAMQGKAIPLKFLLWAIESKKEKLVEMIILHSPHLAKEEKALDEAVSEDLVNIIRILIKNGANGASIGWLRRKFQKQEILDALDGK